MKFAEIVLFTETCKFRLDQLSIRYLVIQVYVNETHFITCLKLNFHCLLSNRINFVFKSRGSNNLEVQIIPWM